ncbi:hypothetical protein NDU88_006642 [Pleurodeles waltl]|uniref:Uncharacterized protein n=1 Tax=Pleurodeles waltl TaxID=8319 RepID=A0AAV7LT59_PLEWA|nr:hypothetical protein NDU88_006642 [Pleurodeles waltl]
MAHPSVEAPGFPSAPPRSVGKDKEGEEGEPQSGPGPGVATPLSPAASPCPQTLTQRAPATRDRGRRARPSPSQALRSSSFHQPSDGRRSSSAAAAPTVIGPTGEYPGGTLERALCLCKHVHEEEEATRTAATRDDEDTAGGSSENKDRGLKNETPEVPEGTLAATE